MNPIRQLLYQYLNKGISRRQFVSALVAVGVGSAAAGKMAKSLAVPKVQAPIVQLEDVTGGRITCELLREWGVEFVFGNTGAYEAGFVDALVDYPDIRYVMGLHEGPVMAMADGYSRISGKTAFVNVHAITGTANALGAMVNAWTDNSSVVVTVGMSETSSQNLGAFTETNKLESVPELYSKLSFRVSRTENLSESMRRAFQLASALPSGPVFLGVPMDVWIRRIAKTEIIPAQRSSRENRPVPETTAIRKAAELLAQARNPLLISGAELPRWGGLSELVELADWLGATVTGDTTASRSSMGFPSAHPRFLGPLARPIETDEAFDLALIAGASRFTLMRGGRDLIPKEATVVELGIREDHLARNYPADLLLFGHAEGTLQLLLEEVKQRSVDAAVLQRRRRNGEALAQKRRSRLQEKLEQMWDAFPIAPERLAAEINRAVDSDAVIVTETVSSDAYVRDYIDFDQPGGGRRHVISSGGSLGWGLGAGCGVKLGAPGHQVVTLLGDGGFQFATQALWTARRFEIPMIVILFNNRNYQANRWALAGLRGRSVETGKFIGVSLEDPDIDHVGIARSYGLDGERVERPEQIAPALQRAVSAERRGRFYLLDVIVDRRGGAAEVRWHEKYSLFEAD